MGPLDLLHDSWLNSDSENVNVSELLIDVKARMAEMTQLVSTRETKAKEKMKSFMIGGCQDELGEIVLVRKPGLISKIGDSWDG